MGYKVFLDTNIVLDLFHEDRPFYQDAVQLFSNVDANRCSGFVTESVFTTAAYVLHKSMDSKQINVAISQLNTNLQLLSCYPFLVTKSLIKNPSDFEDGLLYEIALHHELDYFITSNIKDFKSIQQSNLPVLNARQFNKILQNEEKI